MAGLPTGTVTFLFTDIEGSTRLWEKHPDVMRAALARHDELLLSAVEGAGGRIFASGGDGFAVVFQGAGQAVAAALAAQQSLAMADWGGVRLRVRMGLHTGEADERRGNYFGPAVNQTARLMAAGHGGQVLLSAATREVLGRGLPDGPGLKDLGEHRLKDLAAAVRLFQLTHPALPDDFPPLLSLEVVRNNLPVQLTSFVGREQELAEIGKLVAGARLVTLTGAGGCGKTRVAVQAAAQLVEEFPDGVWLVELAPVSDPQLVVSTVARAVGLSESADPLAGLLDFLGSRRTLLVMDNCEHLLDAVARLVTQSLKAAVELRVLATSREPLGIPGEVVSTVSPLSVPPADASRSDVLQFESVRLFRERAEAARPGFRVTTDNAAAVGLVCRLLEGIPLALELAAARLRVLSAQQIADKLSESLSVLGTVRGDEVPHHRTLQATLDWSYGLLSQIEQKLVTRLSVFVGGWTVDAAEQVCGGADGIAAIDVFDLLSGLVDKSMVVTAEGPTGSRYRLLEPIRQYAHQLLASTGRESAVRAGHADYFARLAEEAFPRLMGPDEAAWLDRLEADVDNLRAALAWYLESGHISEGQLMAGALWRFWLYTFRWSEGSDWLLRMVERDPTPGQPRARALLGLGALSYGSGVRDGAVNLDEAIDLYRGFGPVDELGSALNNRGILAGILGDWQLAASLHTERLELARRSGDDLGIVQSAGNLSRAKLELGDLDEAAVLAEEALRLARKAGSVQWLYVALDVAADVATSQGNDRTARLMLEEAIELSRRPGVRPQDVGDALIALAELSYREGQIEAAQNYLAQHHQEFDNLGYGEPEIRAEGEYYSLWLRGEIDIARGHYREGVILIAACLQKFEFLMQRPRFRKHLEEALDQAGRTLGEEAFTQAWNEGSAMTTVEAITFALEDREEADPRATKSIRD